MIFVILQSNDEEMSETEEEDVEIPSFLDTVKGLDTFLRFIESVENVHPK